jgi:hypothetical protein
VLREKVSHSRITSDNLGRIDHLKVGCVFVYTGSLLLLLVLNLLLCKNVAASPACAGGAANCRLSLQDLFTRAVALSDNIYKVAEDTFRDFVSIPLIASSQRSLHANDMTV